MSDNSAGVSITVLLPSGRLPLDIMKITHELAEQYDFGIYFSLTQNMRLINVRESAVAHRKTGTDPDLYPPLLRRCG